MSRLHTDLSRVRGVILRGDFWLALAVAMMAGLLLGKPALGWNNFSTISWPKFESGGCDDGDCPQITECGVTHGGNPINYMSGEMGLSESDLPAVAGGWLRHSRSFRHQIAEDFDGPVGLNWQVEQWPNIVVLEEENDIIKELVVMLPGNRARYFKLEGGDYVLRHGNPDRFHLEHDTGENLFILTQQTETSTITYTFGDFQQTDSPRGLLLSHTDSAGITTEAVTYDDVMISEFQQDITHDGTTIIYSLVYEYYIGGPNVDRMESATLRKRVDEGAWEPIRRVAYEYYGNMESHGSLNDLKLATIQVPDGSGGWDDTQVTYYRYYKGAHHEDTNPGRDHLLKYKVGPEGWRQLSQDGDPLLANDEDVKKVADYYFEYDDEDKIILRTAAPWCGGCGGSHGGESFERVTNGGFPSDPDDPYNAWKYKVTRTFPDDNQEVVYTNQYGQVMLQIYREEGGSREWMRFYRFNEQGQVVLEAEPSAITGLDDEELDLMEWDDQEGKFTHLADSDGLIHLTTYYDSTDATSSTPGGAANRERARYVQNGQTATPIKVQKLTYYERKIGDFGIYPVAEQIRFPDANDPNITLVSANEYEWVTGEFRLTQRTRKLPAVPGAQNGQNIEHEVTEIFDGFGRVIWRRDARGVISHYQRDVFSGRVVMSIDDVDTTIGGLDVPSGWSTDSGFGRHVETEYVHDHLGRLVQVLGPEHEAIVDDTPTTVRHTTWYVHQENAPDEFDESWVGRGYAGSSDELVGAVSISVRDKIGRGHQSIRSVRTTGSGALSADDTFDRADWVSWSVNEYNSHGKVIAVRSYHDIPGSGDGTEGEHYGKSRFAYHPDIDERIRTVSPGGTITRLVYEPGNFGRHRVVAVWVGTDDTDATPDDPTGESAANNNMVLNQMTINLNSEDHAIVLHDHFEEVGAMRANAQLAFPANQSGHAGYVFGYEDADNYWLYVMHRDHTTGIGTRKLIQVVAGTPSVIATENASTIATTVQLQFRAKRKSPNHWGSPFDLPDGFPPGKIGVFTDIDAMKLDWFRIWKDAQPV